MGGYRKYGAATSNQGCILGRSCHGARLLASLAGVLALALSGLATTAVAQSNAPLKLTLAIANEQGEPSQPAIDAFIEQVATLSNGTIVIDPLYGAGNATPEGFEAGVAGLVERGEADLGLNASRAWDLEGVTSLQALQAPFLITDGALAAAVATSAIATRALAGMADKGVTGLTLWPEDVRHPFALGAHAPFLTPDDFKGANILVQPSALSRSLITTLGGTLYVDGDRDADAAAGILQGAESGLLQGATLPGYPTATGDVTFYPKFQVISANAARFAGLTPEQQGVLRAAAAETQRLTISAHTSEADAAAAWCANGGAVVMAGPDGVAAFEAAAKPVFDAISKDPLTAQLISDIQALKATTTPAPGATACNAVAASPGPVASPGAGSFDATALEGTWHTDRLTEDEFVAAFVAAGGSEGEGHQFFAQLGHFDSTRNTQYAVIGARFVNGINTEFESGDGAPEVQGGHATYEVSADGILTLTDRHDGSKGHFAITLDGDELRLRALDPCPADCHPYGETLFASFPFQRGASAVATGSSIPDGTYTTIATKEDAVRTGWQDQCALQLDGAHLKLVLKGGHFRQLEGCQGIPESVGDTGSYTSTADRFVMTSDCCPGAATMAWALAGDTLTLHVLHAPDPLAVAQFMYDHDWTRVP